MLWKEENGNDEKSLVNTKANKTSHYYHQTVKKENTLQLPCLSLHSAVAL